MCHAVLAASGSVRPLSTLPSGSPIEAVMAAKASAIFGFRCMIRMLFGTKPRFFRIASNCSFSSGECSGGSG